MVVVASRAVPVPGIENAAAVLYRPLRVGDVVERGQLCGEVHFIDNPARAPVPCYFKAGGFVICKRHLGRVERGDCVAHLAVDSAG